MNSRTSAHHLMAASSSTTSRPLRITFVLPYAGLQGGIRVIAVYADMLARRGHSVSVIAQPQVFSNVRKIKSLLAGRGIPRPEPSHLDQYGVPYRILDRPRPVTDDDVPDGDVVIATYYTTAPGVRYLSPRKGAKAIFIQNYEVAEGKTNALLDESWRMPMHKIVISRWLVELAGDKFGDKAISHIPNSVDMTQFHAPPRDKQARPTVGVMYSKFALKGFDTSVKALRRLAASTPDLRVISFGAERPDFRLPLPAFAEFHLRPAQATLRDLYSQCDLWLCGSNVEGFHLPPLEAMACRCPVVSTRVGGPMDIVEEGVNGHLVDTKDSVALADRMQTVLRLPPAKWRQMSDAALATATRYSWRDATLKFEQALRRAIDRGEAANDTRTSSAADATSRQQ